MARDLQAFPGYTEWRNFLLVKKAKLVWFNSHQPLGDHFVDVNKMICVARFARSTSCSLALAGFSAMFMSPPWGGGEQQK